MAHTSCPLTLLVGRRPDAAYGLDGARYIPLVPRPTMQAPDVGEGQIPKIIFVGHDCLQYVRQVRGVVLCSR